MTSDLSCCLHFALQYASMFLLLIAITFHCLLVFNTISVVFLRYSVNLKISIKTLYSVPIPSIMQCQGFTHLTTFLIRSMKASVADRQKFLPYMATCGRKDTYSKKTACRYVIKILYTVYIIKYIGFSKKTKMASSLMHSFLISPAESDKTTLNTSKKDQPSQFISGVSNPVPGGQLSCKVQLQPASTHLPGSL